MAARISGSSPPGLIRCDPMVRGHGRRQSPYRKGSASPRPSLLPPPTGSSRRTDEMPPTRGRSSQTRPHRPCGGGAQVPAGLALDPICCDPMAQGHGRRHPHRRAAHWGLLPHGQRRGRPSLAQQPIIACVRANPKPHNRVSIHHAERPIIVRDAGGPLASDSLEMHGRVVWIFAPLAILLDRLILDAGRQLAETSPKGFRGPAIHPAGTAWSFPRGIRPRPPRPTCPDGQP